MAKQKKELKEKSIEVTLWDAANKLRGTVEPAEYKHVVLGLIFLKFASDKFEQRRAQLIAEGKENTWKCRPFTICKCLLFKRNQPLELPD